MNAVANTAKINTDGLSIEVERVANHATIHGARGPRVYVRIRPAGAEPGRDYGPRTCLTLAPEDAQAFGILLQQAALAERSAA